MNKEEEVQIPMCTQVQFNNLLDRFVKNSRELFGEKLKDIILFGSYARGDFDDESDVDIFLLLDIPENEAWKYRNSIVEATSDISLEYDVLISPVVEPFVRYQKYKDVIPFLQNIRNEGVHIGA